MNGDTIAANFLTSRLYVTLRCNFWSWFPTSGVLNMHWYLHQRCVLFSDRLPQASHGRVCAAVRLQHQLLPVSRWDLQRLLPETHP
jgi:hypothetical protein